MNNFNEYEQLQKQTDVELTQEKTDRLLNLDSNSLTQNKAREMIKEAMKLGKSIKWIGYTWSKNDYK